ncbi:ATP-grasp domain-containing protein [uncultured Rubinisphaera sp.]|uniref:carboxylate--amine ligase n=1 Tax=uncultured Rubinisphaera sp. TaxID=1678686 RepID=UPI0030D79E58
MTAPIPNLTEDNESSANLSRSVADSVHGRVKPSSRLLILGNDARTVLPIAHSLGRRGLELHLNWSDNNPLLKCSRFISKCHSDELDAQQPAESLKRLLACIEKYSIEAILPTSDAACIFLQQSRSKIPQHLLLGMSDAAACDVVFNKKLTAQLARSLNIAVPAQQIVSTPQELDLLKNQFPGKVALKPLYSSNGNRQKQFAALFPDLKSCQKNWPGDHIGPLQLQEYFEGEAQGVVFMASEGTLILAMQHHRLHETSGHGSTYRESIPLNPELLSATNKMLKALKYTGVGMCEFRVNPENGEWVLLEINGRFWGSLPLAINAGLDFPYYYWQLLTGNKPDVPEDYRQGVRCRNLRQDLRWMWRQFVGKQSDPYGTNGWKMNSISRLELFTHAFRLLTFQDHLDYYSRDDLRPFLQEIKAVLTAPIRRWKKSPSNS